MALIEVLAAENKRVKSIPRPKLSVFNSLPPVLNQSHFGWEELQVVECPHWEENPDFVDWARTLSRRDQRGLVNRLTKVIMDDQETDEIYQAGVRKMDKVLRKAEKTFKAEHGITMDEWIARTFGIFRDQGIRGAKIVNIEDYRKPDPPPTAS